MPVNLVVLAEMDWLAEMVWLMAQSMQRDRGTEAATIQLMRDNLAVQIAQRDVVASALRAFEKGWCRLQ